MQCNVFAAKAFWSFENISVPFEGRTLKLFQKLEIRTF